MIKIDAHQHFWNYDPKKHEWIQDHMQVLRQHYLPNDLEEIYILNKIDGCVAVQADQSESETQFLLELAAIHDFILGVVGWVDLRATDIEERLAHFSSYPLLKGFRHVVQDEPDPAFMLQDSFKRGLSLFKEYNFTYDILVFPKQLEATLEIVSLFPDTHFVLDHIAKPLISEGAIAEWKDYILRLGQFPNVYCKISGMVTEAKWDSWTYDDFVPYLDVVFEAFGVERIMFGSDWPVCLLAASYQQVKDILVQYTSSFSMEDKAKIWYANAADFYDLDISNLLKQP